MSDATRCDLLVIGSGPAGQNAALQAARAGLNVAVVERERGLGGSCVYRGTIPSKTLRESALQLNRLRRGPAPLRAELNENMQVSTLTGRMEQVIRSHGAEIARQLQQHGVRRVHGRARFVSPSEVDVVHVDGQHTRVQARHVVVAAGSRPRRPEGIPVDHENVLDSDSILSMIYLPRSLTVLGAGVIASEYASIFAILGVSVTMTDRHPRPLDFLDAELTDRFLASFSASGGTFLGGRAIRSVHWDGISRVITRLDDGNEIASEKMLVALGRVANVDQLDVERAGLQVTSRGLLEVDENCRTATPGVYAVGDVIGPPSLASSAMEQGRRAVCAAVGVEPGPSLSVIPSGIYAIPEMSTVGLTEQQAVAEYGSACVGRAQFEEVARGQISGIQDGMLKLVADPDGQRVLGVSIVGDGATELIHIGQMGILNGCNVDTFVENVFNFPTLAEAYRIAALDIVAQRRGARPTLGSEVGQDPVPAPALR